MSFYAPWDVTLIRAKPAVAAQTVAEAAEVDSLGCCASRSSRRKLWARTPPGGRTWQISLATSSIRISSPRFLSLMASYDVGGQYLPGPTRGRLDDVNELAGAAAKMLQPMVGGSRGRAAPAVSPLLSTARNSLWRLLATQSSKFDLGSADLFTVGRCGLTL